MKTKVTQPNGWTNSPPLGRGRINSPADGYRHLANDLLFTPIEQINRGRHVERNLGFLLSRRARICFALLDIDADVAIAAILARNGLETINYAERIKAMRSTNGR